MIITKEVEVCIVPSNINYYRSVGLDVKMMDKIKIGIERIQPQSNIKIEASCDRCGTQRTIKMQAYTLNISRSKDNKTYMCDKCSHEKIKMTNLEKYGKEYFSQTEMFNEKIKETSLLKFGVEHYSKTEDYLKSRTETNISKYGVSNPFELTEKIKESILSKYGVDHPSKIESLKESKEIKRRETRERNGDWIKQSELSDWNIYKNKVRTETIKNKKIIFENWDGTDFYDGEYIKDYLILNHNDPKYPTVDHKISVYKGFVESIDTNVISSIENLVITKRILNIKKGK